MCHQFCYQTPKTVNILKSQTSPSSSFFYQMNLICFTWTFWNVWSFFSFCYPHVNSLWPYFLLSELREIFERHVNKLFMIIHDLELYFVDCFWLQMELILEHDFKWAKTKNKFLILSLFVQKCSKRINQFQLFNCIK